MSVYPRINVEPHPRNDKEGCVSDFHLIAAFEALILALGLIGDNICASIKILKLQFELKPVRTVLGKHVRTNVIAGLALRFAIPASGSTPIEIDKWFELWDSDPQQDAVVELQTAGSNHAKMRLARYFALKISDALGGALDEYEQSMRQLRQSLDTSKK